MRPASRPARGRRSTINDKKRLDVTLTERGLEQSRERARAIIMSGIVYVNGQKADKAGMLCAETDSVEIRGKTLKYAGRGGLKLEKALACFQIDVSGKCAVDVGASTGGFTDCLLQNGARKVFAIDVGYGQLAWKLRTDARVVCMERTNIRYVTPDMLGEAADFAAVDVSFISLRLVLPVVKTLLSSAGCVVALIKPQFEAGREKVGKKGVVREPEIHVEVLETCIEFVKQIGYTVSGLTYSPVRGPEGNIEFLIYLTQQGTSVNPCALQVVADAHRNAV